MRLGVLTGGGDAPGLNAAIRAVVRRSLQFGLEVVGIKNGWAGLVDLNAEPLDAKSVSGILPVGGTILGTSRTNPMRDEAMMQRVLRNFDELGLDALVAIGGDDTLRVAYEIHRRGKPIVGIPKTMDNDVYGTDYCIGFDTATTVVAEALDRLHTTASAHHRVIVLEVMGREAGWVAVVGGLAGGADFILIPEVPRTVDEVVTHLYNRRKRGKDFSLIVVAEGVRIPELEPPEETLERDAFGHVLLYQRSIGERLANEIARRTGFETRFVVLGHLQRGGSPTVFDRVLATRFGVKAVDLVREGRFGTLPVLRGREIAVLPLEEVAGRTKKVDPELYELAEIFF
jgi:phosphofructokinase-like protein